MTYYGSYDDRLQFLHQWVMTHADTQYHHWHNADLPANCSIFDAVGDSGRVFLGRNLDNKPTGILLAQYNPPGKYRSFAFSRMEDLKVSNHAVPEKLSDDDKMRFLYFPYYPTDGINEKGLAIGLAGVHPQMIKPSHEKELIFVTLFIRSILDDCASVAEAAEFSKRFNLFDGSLSTISHHFLVADAEGNSLIIEYDQGEMKHIQMHNQSTVITNRFVYQRSLESKMQCWRYSSLHNDLSHYGRAITDGECLQMLQNVYNGTEWSVVYNLRERSGQCAVNGNYGRRYTFQF
jgi:penicillin V acylase-like amidase (Ntn superfamily)